MEKEATGWVPDYPDIRDYTLRSKAIRSVINPIQGTQIAGTLESQKENILQLLQLIAKRLDTESDTLERQTNEIKEIKNIQSEINHFMGNEVKLVEVILVKKSVYEGEGKTIGTFDIDRIPAQVFQIILEKLLPNISITYIKLNQPSVYQALTQLIYPIVGVVAQIISPIAQNSNVSKIISNKGIKYFKFLIFDGTEDSKKHSLSESDYQIMLYWKSENKLFKELAYSAVMKVKLKCENLAKEKQVIYEKVKKELQPYFDKVQQSKEPPTESTVLEIVNPRGSKEEPLQEGRKTLQFPILRKHIDRIQKNNHKGLKHLIDLPEFMDLSFWCSPVEDQGSLNSCTANAAIALMEYFQNKSFGKYINGSRLFLYKATRNLMQIEGNVGTSIRSTMKAMALFGVPPEEYWPYQEDKVNEEPIPFCYAFAQNYQALKYFRLDSAVIEPEQLLAQIKVILVAGIPCVFGFTLYYSIYDDSNPRGHIPFPHERDKAEGGHAVVAVGYDDYKQIENADDRKSKGALLIRNCWGTKWGEGGYGWLPYEYVLKGLTADWWSLLSSEWFDTEQFGLGGKDWTDNVSGPRK